MNGCTKSIIYPNVATIIFQKLHPQGNKAHNEWYRPQKKAFAGAKHVRKGEFQVGSGILIVSLML